MTRTKPLKADDDDEEVPTITRTFRVRLVKPTKGGWDALGDILRGVQVPQHRVMNKAITELEIEHRQGKKTNPRTRAYQLIRKFWEEEREASRARESVRVERAKKAAKKKKKKTAKEKEPVDLRPSLDALISTTAPSSSVLLGVASVVLPRWAKYRKEAFQGTMTLPSFRGGQPIYVASSSNAVQLSQTPDGDLVLTLRLVGGHGGKRGIIVNPCGPKDHSVVRKVLKGETKLGDCKLVLNKRTKRWEAILSATSPKPEESEGGRIMAVHHGVRHLLTYAISKSDDRTPEAGVLEDGGDIVVHRKKYLARRKSLGHHFKALGTGAKGRGKKRREQHLTKLKDAERRWTRTRCQEAAAHLLKLAQKRGVTQLFVPDWSSAGEDWKTLPDHLEQLIRAFPLAQIREFVIQGAASRGIAVKVLPPAHDSRTCPRCGSCNEPSNGAPMFFCQNDDCKFTRDVDVVAAVNMLQREGHPLSFEEMDARAAKQAEKLKP